MLAILALAGTGGVIIASDSASPGDSLYSIDLAAERVRLALATSSETKAQIQTELAQERVEEALKLAQQQREQHMIQALERYEKHIEEAQKNADEAKEQGKDVDGILEKLSENHLRHQEVLGDVFEKAPEQAKEAIRNAIENNERNYQKTIDAVSGQKREEIQERHRERLEEISEQLEEEGITLPTATPSQLRRGN